MKKYIREFSLAVLLSVSMAALITGGTVSVYAQSPVNIIKPCSEFTDPSTRPTVCKEEINLKQRNSNPLFGEEGVLTKFINMLSIVVGIASVIAIIAAGLRFMLSGSNSQEVNVAREMVLYACVALILAASAQAIVRFWLSKI